MMLAPSTRLGLHEILAPIGAGGMWNTVPGGIIGTVASVRMLLMIKEPLTASQADAAGAPRKINVVLNWTQELKALVRKE